MKFKSLVITFMFILSLSVISCSGTGADKQEVPAGIENEESSIYGDNGYGGPKQDAPVNNIASADETKVVDTTVPADTGKKDSKPVESKDNSNVAKEDASKDEVKKEEEVKSDDASKDVVKDDSKKEDVKSEDTNEDFEEAVIWGKDASYIDGNWYFGKNKSIYTFWQNLTVGYKVNFKKAGFYNVMIKVRNYGTLPIPPKYTVFKLKVNTDADEKVIEIEAKKNGASNEKLDLYFGEGVNNVYITWLNDMYKKDVYDANIEIESIKIKRNPVQKSNLTAMIVRGFKTNKMLVGGILGVLGLSLVGIFVYNKKRS